MLFLLFVALLAILVGKVMMNIEKVAKNIWALERRQGWLIGRAETITALVDARK
jgi:hypothetical protein